MSPSDRPASVVLCAYTLERWDDLCGAVEAAHAQLLADDDLILVVDHNDELLARSRERWAGADRTAIVPNDRARGLSGARNTAIGATSGEILVFLDDDATLTAGSLARLRAPFAEPEVVAVGGAPVPRWVGGRRPGWFPAELDWTIGCAYTGMPTTRADVRNPIGAIMAIRREVFDGVGLFLEGVGRVGTVPLGCEETELAIRARQAQPQARVVYEPGATVLHTVTEGRATARYLLRRGYAEGLSKAAISRHVGAGDALASETSYVTSTLPRGVARELGRTVRGDVHGLGAASAIVGVLVATGAGYVRGRVTGVRVPAAPEVSPSRPPQPTAGNAP
ncbi:MAG: glycosyltransferase [Cellulomonas sp.]|nr:glycosyltransferase [Cellulomonas sp.]